jgi:hypothetical protein
MSGSSSPISGSVYRPKRDDDVGRFGVVKDRPNVHHDALELPDGQIVLVTSLCEGQHATVLQLPASPRVTSDTAVQASGSLVGQPG